LRLLSAALLLACAAQLHADPDVTPPGKVTNLDSTSSSHDDAIGKWHDDQSQDDSVEVTWTAASDNSGGSGING